MANEGAPQRKARLEKAIQWADLVGKVVSPLALMIGAMWAYNNFTVEKVHGQNLLVAVDANPVDLDDKLALLNIDITLRNIGKIPIYASKPGEDSRGEGCELSILRYDGIEKVGNSPTLLNWKNGPGDWKTKEILRKYNVLKGSPAFDSSIYVINPGLEVHERVAAVLPKGSAYVVRARFWHGGSTMSDLKYVVVK